MRIMPSILSVLGRGAHSLHLSGGKFRRDHINATRRQDHSTFHPIGQSYTWGGPPTPSNGFAPAIGYDGFSGGYGY